MTRPRSGAAEDEERRGRANEPHGDAGATVSCEDKWGGGRESQSWAGGGASSGDAETRWRIRHGYKGVRGDRGTATDGPGSITPDLRCLCM